MTTIGDWQTAMAVKRAQRDILNHFVETAEDYDRHDELVMWRDDLNDELAEAFNRQIVLGQSLTYESYIDIIHAVRRGELTTDELSQLKAEIDAQLEESTR